MKAEKCLLVAMAAAFVLAPLAASAPYSAREDTAIRKAGLNASWDPDSALAEFVKQYNQHSSKLPDAVKGVIGTETIRVNLTLKNGRVWVFGVKTENGAIKEYQKNPYPDSTMALHISEELVERIATSKDPIEELMKAWGTEIRFEGLNFGNSFRLFFADAGFRIYSFFYSLGRPSLSPMPGAGSVPRSQGIMVNLASWWMNVSADYEIGMDPLGGALYLYWLDTEGNICHGNPGVSGQPGPILIIHPRFAELREKRDTLISAEDLARLQNDSYMLGSYDGDGQHMLQYRSQVWRERSMGMVFEDFSAVQSSIPIDITISADSISSGRVRPIAMLRLNGYNCSFTEYGSLPVPGTGLDSSGSGQHPTICRARQPVTASQIARACLEGRLEGGLSAGYMRIR